MRVKSRLAGSGGGAPALPARPRVPAARLAAVLAGAILWTAAGGGDEVGAATDRVIEESLTLTSDMTVTGNLTIVNKAIDINLNGHKLTVGGNLIQQNGKIDLNGGSIEVDGDYRLMRLSSSDTTYGGYTYCDGSLVMDDATDSVKVGGSFYIGSDANYYTGERNSVFTAGTISVAGDFKQYDPGWSAKGFVSKGTKVILNGTGKQTVHFNNPKDSYWTAVDFQNSNIIFDGMVPGWSMVDDVTLDNGLGDGFVGNMLLNGHNLTVKGDFTISDGSPQSSMATWGNLTLGGGTLKVSGNLLQTSGIVTVDSGTIAVDGDYRLEKKNSDGTYNYSEGLIRMENAKGSITAGKSFIISSSANYYDTNTHSVLTAGKITFGKDFRQEDLGWSGKGFQAEGTKVVAKGSGEHHIFFNNPYDSWFSELVTEDPVIFDSVVKGWKLTHDTTLSAKMDYGTCGTFDLNGYTMTINGDAVIGDGTGQSNIDKWGNLKLSGGKFVAKGDLLQTAGVVTVDTGSILVEGDYRLEKKNSDGTYNYSDGLIKMEKEEGLISVGGSFIISSAANYYESNTHSAFTAGTITIGKDFRQEDLGWSGKGFQAEGTKVIVRGEGEHHIFFNNPYDSWFSDLVTEAPVTIDSLIKGWTLTADTEFAASMTFGTCGTFDLNGHTMTVNGDVIIGDGSGQGSKDVWGNLNFTNGGTLVAKGNFLQTAGIVTLGEGTIKVAGDYRLEKKNSDGTYNYSDGVIVMEKAKGLIDVEGGFYISSSANFYESNVHNAFSAGTITVGKDFKQEDLGWSGKGFQADGTLVVLDGAGEQHVSFNNPTTCWFYDLKLDNTNVVFDTMIMGWKLQRDTIFGNGMPNRSCGTFDLNGYTLTSNGDFVFGNSVGKGNENYGKLLVGTGKLIVNGNLRQESAVFDVGTGSVIVSGDYRIERKSTDDSYSYSSGCLVMTDPSAYILVKGSFYCSTNSNYYADEPVSKLTAGTLEVKGNFTQEDLGWSAKSFAASGSHRVVLSGSGSTIQYVTFNNYPDSKFANLVLTRDLQYYVFNPELCWDNRTTGTAGSESYQITFDATGGTLAAGASNRTVVAGQAYGTLPSATRENYSFDGWYTSKTGGTQVSAQTIAAADVVVYAHWTSLLAEETYYTVTFDPNGGVLGDASTRKVLEGALLGGLPLVSRTGYELDGWFTSASGGTRIDASTVINGNVTCYAQWKESSAGEEGTYTITLDPNGGELISDSNKLVVNAGEAIDEFPMCTRECYEFDGWYIDDTEITAGDVIEGNVTLVAMWTLSNYKVTLDCNGGGLADDEDDFVYVELGESLGALPVPTRSGYEFLGWYTASAGGGQVKEGAAVSGNLTLYAQWQQEVKEYQITMDPNGGVLADGKNSFTKESGAKLGTLPIVLKLGYTFDGWYTEKSGGTKVTSGTVVTNAMTLYAHWTICTYTIRFDANGGTSSKSSISVQYNNTYRTLPTATRSGYTFDGWYTEKSGGTKVTGDTVAHSDATVYAHWTAANVTLSFKANGGKITKGKSSVTVTSGSKFGTLPTVTRKGYTFTGWYTKKSGGKKVTSSTKATANATLYARWTKISVGKAKLKSVKAGSKSFTAAWSKVSGVSGYELRYSTKSNMKAYKTQLVASSKTKYTIKKLSAKKKYYVVVYSYKTDSTGAKVYSKVSNKLNATTKK